MKSLLIISSLRAGGAEKNIALLANALVERCDKEIGVLVLNDDKIEQDFFVLSDRVKRINADLAGASANVLDALAANIKRLKVIRQIIKSHNPESVVCFCDRTNITALIATAFLTIPVFISERNNPQFASMGWVWRKLRNLTYPFAAGLVVQTEALKDYCNRLGWNQNIKVIANPIDVQQNYIDVEPDAICNDFVAVGSLSYQKGFDLLIAAFAIYKKSHAAARLTIYGEGKERSSLEALVSNLGLTKSVLLPGQRRTSASVMNPHKIFILSSRFEGLPNVLLEAMALGCPCISFDCEFGPREIIDDEVNGLLVPNGNVDSLYQAMKQLAHNPELRQSFSVAARQSMIKFEPQQIFQQWCTLLQIVDRGEVCFD